MLDADDSTSFTSSLATSASEPEDFFLGVEAYSFENSKPYTKKEPVEQKKLNWKNNKISIPLQQDNPKSQVSKLKNIQQILAAREFDACSVLFNLGFGFRNANNNKEKLQILQRFKGSEGIIKRLEKNEDCCANQQNEYVNKQYIEDKGVNKARDWLNFYHSDQSQSLVTNSENKTNETNGSNKKNINRIGKMKSRFLKSRQSSFEIMPYLEEEEISTNNSVTASDRKLKRQHNVVVSNGVINEGSFEEDCNANSNKVSKVLANNSVPSLHNTEDVEVDNKSHNQPNLQASYKNMNEDDEFSTDISIDDKSLIRKAIDKLQNTSCVHRNEFTDYEAERMNSNTNNNNSKKIFKDSFLFLHRKKYFKICKSNHVLLHLKSAGQKFN